MASDASRPTLSSLENERGTRREKVKNALQEEEDPLATYLQFIKWTEENYRGELLGQSGLLVLLEEACRTFIDDASYKCDLRYFKIWARYASLVEKPSAVYSYLLDKEIGVVFSQLYDEYALQLERERQYAKAEEIYQKGIKRRARPMERLRKSYEEFQKRSASTPRTAPPKLRQPRCKWAAEDEALRQHPLRNIKPSSSLPSLLSSSSSAAPESSNSMFIHPTCTAEARYKVMTAPPPEGKRPEKRRFNFDLLWTKEGVEYSIQEARARSKGLLNKKWDPDPVSIQRVQFNDDGQKTSRGYTTTGRRLLTAGEPTVTINTKEALADVFGMYNSPEKSMRFANVAGSKHAPVKKIEPMAPLVFSAGQSRSTTNENPMPHANAPARTPLQAFRPFTDENADADLPRSRATSDENSGAHPKTPVFRPFVEEEKVNNARPAFRPFLEETAKSSTPGVFKTPDAGRRALAMKDSSASKDGRDENAPALRVPVFKPLSEQAIVFRPPSVEEKPALGGTSIAATKLPSTSQAFTPFREANGPGRVFSRPSENAFVPKRSVLGEKAGDRLDEVPPSNRLPLRQAFTPFVEADPEDNWDPSEDSWDDEEQEQAEFQPAEEDEGFSSNPTEDEEENYEYQEELEPYHTREAPLGGRFGSFDIMTPITERTYEFTMSTRAFTPTSTAERAFLEEDAHDAAEQLAEELRTEREWAEYREASVPHNGTAPEEEQHRYSSLGEENVPPFRVSDGHTIPLPPNQVFTAPEPPLPRQMGRLSLSDTLLTVSSFVPPNPCNPFDPDIIQTLLGISPRDASCHDLKQENAGQLEKLQKFAEKRQRRSSGNTSGNTSRLADTLDVFDLRIADSRFEVTHKLGEGGFGAVFAAKDISSRTDDDDFEDDDEDASLYAIKVVKPRNLWEYHILRRIHRTLSPRLKCSVVQAHALYAFHDESYLILDLCPQGTLLDVVNNASKMSVSQQGACLDEVLVTFFSVELIRLIEGMHSAGIIHGDLKIDNCLLRLEDAPGGLSAWSTIYQPSGKDGWEYKGIKLIDFGRTIDTQVFPAGQQFIADWPADARDCFEIRENRPWTYQTDYFGLAGIIYCLLFGKYLEKAAIVPVDDAAGQEGCRYKLSTPFKRYWNTDLWSRLFDLLLNPCFVREDGKLPLCEEISVLRKEMEAWLEKNCDRSSGSLRALLKKIEKFVNS
ncbi:hypothetical protein GLOTRDRAFT_139495 [Gloeophyllum trabeum ATCC 11539]|uniref:Kinase-like protein n=1 Tax=Gloeophyllum trabeum (strain ATCC 11539 / FP-39264 / Madison 617) TaxID=670483 RepID=S7Q3T3_GLOTA|nr:uncharacterized protein GLOTRDRAFT_139495 [Gloeophyllum trabeum ATCC 11539]EPQ54098.1 hypothetical protein GLOTRDRAFT_139495 [Gloeophyllum trabeum ATCC 11539]